ncbi:MAG: acetate--CoA ligase family protein, partial [Sphingobium sp.]
GILGSFQSFEDVIAIVGQDEAVSLVAVCFDLADSKENDNFGPEPFSHFAKGIRRAGVPGFLQTQSYLTVTPYARELLESVGMPARVSGLGTGMRAVGAAFRWSEAVRRGAPEVAPVASAALSGPRPTNEREALDFLSAHGVPVIPAHVARSGDEAAAIAERLAAPVALKILSPDIAHKTEVGGVSLNIAGADAARAEYVAMAARVAAARPVARIDGITISPMRGAGVELIVGIARDPTWGLVLAVGLGGVLVEVLADADLALLPVSPNQVEEMLGRLKAARLLDGYRGQPAIDRRKVAEAVAAIGNAAIALGPDLMSLEVNPLWVSGSHVECLDALMIWADTPAH